MFGLHVPGFLNPLTPFKNAAAVLGTAVKDAKEVASTPFKMAAHEANMFKDVLHLDFKGAAKEQVGLVTQPLQTTAALAGNSVDLVKTGVRNMV